MLGLDRVAAAHTSQRLPTPIHSVQPRHSPEDKIKIVGLLHQAQQALREADTAVAPYTDPEVGNVVPEFTEIPDVYKTLNTIQRAKETLKALEHEFIGAQPDMGKVAELLGQAISHVDEAKDYLKQGFPQVGRLIHALYGAITLIGAVFLGYLVAKNGFRDTDFPVLNIAAHAWAGGMALVVALRSLHALRHWMQPGEAQDKLDQAARSLQSMAHVFNEPPPQRIAAPIGETRFA